MTIITILKKPTAILVLMTSSALAWGAQRKNDATTPPPPCPQGQVRSSSNPNSPCKAAAPSGPAQQQPTHSQSTGAPGSTTPTRTPTTPTRIPTTPGHTPATLGHTPSRIVRIPGDKTVEVNLRPNGKVSDYQTAGMTIHEGSRGGRTIVSEHNGRTIVSTGSDLGYVQRPYLSRKGVDYVQRTYVARGDSYTRVYRETVYRGGHYCTYVPAHYYHPVFYRWAHNPWGPGVHYNWERSYGGYFAPYPVYPTASLWLTDYLIVANLQAPYQAQADANTGPGPGATAASEQVPEPGLAFVPVYVPGTKTLAQGFSAAGAREFEDDYLLLHAGATAVFSFIVPSGQSRTVAYAIPTGSYLNNAPAEVSVNGVTVTTINQGLGGFGERTPTQRQLWQKSFGPGDYVLTIRSGGNFVNVYGLWLGKPSVGGGEPPPREDGSAPMSPEIKQEISDEVKQQLTAEQTEATQVSSPTTITRGATAETRPAALDPAQTIFVVSTNLDVAMVNGQECELTPGDIIDRIDDEPGPDNKVTVRVTSSKPNDCKAGARLMLAVDDLQEMRNSFQEQLDSGLQTLAEKSGTKGLPKAPDTSTVSPEVAAPTPDPDAARQLQAQQQQADQIEKQVQQASQTNQ